MITNNFNLETLQAEVNKLKEEHEFLGVKTVKSPILSGMQMIIKSGENLYYSPDIRTGEVKIITIPPIL